LVIGAAGLNDTTWIRNINTTPHGFIANTNNYVTVRMTDGRLGYSAIHQANGQGQRSAPGAQTGHLPLERRA
jgi:hypothetical protein